MVRGDFFIVSKEGRLLAGSRKVSVKDLDYSKEEQ